MLKKIIPAVISLAMSVGLLAGCSEGSSSEVSSSIVELPAEIAGTAFSAENVMTVDGLAVSNAIYRYFFMNIKNSYFDNGDESYWLENSAALPELITYTSDLSSRYMVTHILAKEYNITLTDEDYQNIEKDTAAAIAEEGGDEAFDKSLSDAFLDRETYQYFLETEYLDYKVYDYFYGENGVECVPEQEIFDLKKKDYVLVKHILILNEEMAEASGLTSEADESSSSLDSEVQQTRLELAQELLQRLENGEDFDTLMKEYGEDPGMLQNPDGYFFTHDEMVKEFEEESFALEEGEMSGIVETSYGYHIIKKLPVQPYLEANIDALKAEYYEKLYTAKIDEKLAGVVCEYEDGYDKIGVRSFN